MKGIIEIINAMNTSKYNVNPTEIYNEGWMTRLLMHYSINKELKLKNEEGELIVSFKNDTNWTSEALIPSLFLNAKAKREGPTHPDIAIGNFSIDFNESGYIKIKPNASSFGIIEAKMQSPLSKGTKHAKGFNQASRNVACIAANTNENCKTFFYVVLPKSKRKWVNRKKENITDFVNTNFISNQIEVRVNEHNKVNTAVPIDVHLIKQVRKCNVGVITYEHWIEQIMDKEAQDELNAFYDECKKWNRIK